MNPVQGMVSGGKEAGDQCFTLQGGTRGTAVLSRAPLQTGVSCVVPFIFLSLLLQELQKYEQYIFADHTNMIHVENVYEEILYQILLDESLKGMEGFPGAGESSR